MEHSQNDSKDGEAIVWAKGDECLCPYSGDQKLYKGVIKKLKGSSIGRVTALVQFVGYEQDEPQEVDIKLLQKRSKKVFKSPAKSSQQLSNIRDTSRMFSPLVGNEHDQRLREKYASDDKEADSKAEVLSKSLFLTKQKAGKSPAIRSSQRKEIVVEGGEDRKGRRKSSKFESSNDDTDYRSPPTRKKNKLDITGGEAKDQRKELHTSKRISDISSILDTDRVRHALSETDSQSDEGMRNGHEQSHQSRARSSKMGGARDSTDSDDDSAKSGFSDSDLEKPKFNHDPEGAKVPFILSEDGETTVIQVPGTLNQYLRDYQREGIKFMYSHYKQNRGAILGDDMGLGKTVQVIGMISAILGKHGNRIDVMRQKPAFIRLLSDSDAVKQESPTIGPILIIGPGCVLYNWLGELETWGYFTVRKFHGTDKMDCLNDIRKGKLEVVVTTYETFREHQESLNTVSWNCVFVDEVHKIKGLKAQTTKALRNINTLRRFGLTGTALQNNLLELWSILDWAQPGCLGRQMDFEEEFVEAIGKGQRHDANKRELAMARKKKEKFAQIRKGMMIRRTKSLIADQLPKKEENVVFCKLSELQTSIYKTILSHEDMYLVLHSDDPCYCESGIPQGQCCKQKTKTGTKIKSLMFTFMHLLLKVSNHVALLIPSNIKSQWQAVNAKKICTEALKHHPEFLSQTKEASFKTLSNPKYCGKMKILQGLLKVFEKEHSKVLVFSYSTQVLDILEQYMMSTGYEYRRIDGTVSAKKSMVLDILEQYMMSTGYEYRRIDGTVSAKKRMVVVREYNTDPNIFICLISTKAGGLGLNLTGANKVVIFDPNWNPSHDLQAQDRAYRIGQRKNVSVYRLVSAGTIEENMYLRQIYKQQLLNISVEDENARRYFYAVQGSRQKKGELFGIKNMFALRTGTSCLTADIIKRNERIESALAGYEIAKYVPPVVRLSEDEDLEDVEISDCNTSTDSDRDVFAEFFKEESDAKATKTNIKQEHEDDIESGDESDIENGSRKSNKTLAKVNIKTEMNNVPSTNEHRTTRVRFNEEEVSGMSRRGKVKPHESRTGKGAVERRTAQRYLDSDEEEVRVDQTLAGTFNDVSDVFENCGIVHIHENRKVVGGSRAEDHMTRCAISDVYELHQNSQDLAVQCDPLSEKFKLHENRKVVGGSRAEDHMTRCAISDVYELHQNSQDLAVQCDPLSESSEEDEEVIENRSHLELQHNKVRSQMVGKTKILIGQTPKPFRRKHFERLCLFTKSESLIEFAEKVLTSSLEERITMLKNYYEDRDPAYKDVIKLDVENISKGRSKKAPKRGGKAKRKTQNKTGRGVSFMEEEDKSTGESLQVNQGTTIDGDEVDNGSSMDIGKPSTPNVRKRKHLRQSLPQKKLRNDNKSPHVQVLPSYLVDENDDVNMEAETPEDRVRYKTNDVDYSLPQALDTDSSVLLSQMCKYSQNLGIDSVDGVDISNDVVQAQQRSRDRNTVPSIDRSSEFNDKMSKPSDRDTRVNGYQRTKRKNDTSILDDLFTPCEKSPKKPPPRQKKDITVKTEVIDKPNGRKRSKVKHDSFKLVDDIFSDSAETQESVRSTESESEVFLHTSTLKNDEFDCFDDPKLWKKKSPKPADKRNVIDRLIADSDAEYNELFTSGKLRKKGDRVNERNESDQKRRASDKWSPSGNVGGSESLFS